MNLTSVINQLNMVSIAYVGDAVYSLFVRERLIRRHDCKSGRLHLLSNSYVKAASQARALDAIFEQLTEAEQDLVRRARNTHTNSKAKNAGLTEYRKSTALEGLIGFLFLSEQKPRLKEIMEMCAAVVEGKQDKD